MKQLVVGRDEQGQIDQLFLQQEHEICAKVDKGFSYLLIFQWVVCILVGIFITPNTWLGQFSGAYENGLLGFVFGGLFALPPVYSAIAFRGQKMTRYLVAVSQMCFSILLIYLFGGRIESHFHVFVSLAALAFYKDQSVLWIAFVIVAADHALREIFLPMSVYGQTVGVQWRWAEHAAWILFENLILIAGIRHIRSELWNTARSKYQLIKAKEEALYLSKVKSKFLSNMSHEIRTPLNSIIGFSDILGETPLDDEQKEYVGTIHRCSDTLLHLINDILDISKIENNLLEIDHHRFDLKELHYDVHRMFSIKSQSKGLELIMKIDEEIPDIVWGDSHRIRQILTNLVSNAVKFTERGQVTVELSAHKEKPAVYCWKIVDTGKGIKEENISKLFRGFYQEDASVTRKYGGSGLGLMICKNLVELMGGKISVSSIVGVGTTFEFCISLQRGD